jgi:hypothetical protein
VGSLLLITTDLMSARLSYHRLAARLGRRRAEVDRVPGNGPGVVVLDHGQPRPGRRTRRCQYPQVELGVVGLPDLVGTARLPAVDQLEHLRVAFVPLDRQGPQRRVDAADDRVDRSCSVARARRQRPSAARREQPARSFPPLHEPRCSTCLASWASAYCGSMRASLLLIAAP